MKWIRDLMGAGIGYLYLQYLGRTWGSTREDPLGEAAGGVVDGDDGG